MGRNKSYLIEYFPARAHLHSTCPYELVGKASCTTVQIGIQFAAAILSQAQMLVLASRTSNQSGAQDAGYILYWDEEDLHAM